MNFYRYFAILAGLSVFLSIFGYWAKITHQSYAGKIFAAGMWSLAICAAIYVYLKISSLKNKN